jgi:hypothetical protein
VSSNHFHGATVFSATMARDRDSIGDKITSWLRQHTEVEVVDTVVSLSSDAKFHCLSITLFWRIASQAI